VAHKVVQRVFGVPSVGSHGEGFFRRELRKAGEGVNWELLVARIFLIGEAELLLPNGVGKRGAEGTLW